MSFIVYFFVALIAAGSVLFGLDWLQAPLSPMPASKYELRAAAPPPPAAAVAKVEPKKIEPKKVEPEQKPATPAPAIAALPPAPVAPVPAPVASEQQPVSIVTPEPDIAAAAPAAAPKCNIEACETAYRSFTAADCTYQPMEGPRRLCTRGAPPAAATAPASSPTEARAQACNVTACAASYPHSFSATDCTFQPTDGPRRACTK
jgi:hypothetical protein